MVNGSPATRCRHAEPSDRIDHPESRDDLGILARRKIEAAVIAPVYDEMRPAFGAAVAAGAEVAAGAPGRALRRVILDCGSPSTANARNFAYLSPTLRASLYCAEFRQFCAASILSNWLMPTRVFGGSPSNAIIFCPAASRWPPAALI